MSTKKYFEFSFKRLEIIFHLLFWVIYFIYPIIKFGEHKNYTFDLQKAITNVFFISSTVYAFYFLLEKALKNKGLFVFLILFFFLMIYLHCYFNVIDCDCEIRICFINSFVEYTFVNIFFIALHIFKKNINHQKVLQKTAQELINAELKALKAQINPHFLFNTLNMLYAKSLKEDKSLPENILKLSDNLHYLLHEGEKKSVTLTEEVTFIKDYIELHKARLDKKNDVTFLYETDNSNQAIPPLLLIPFVENAFKFSSMIKGSQLPIKITIKLVNGFLNFYAENRFESRYKTGQNEIWKTSGIGMKNVQKRLSLLFPKSHTLHLSNNDNIFKVHLTIQL